MIDHMTTYFSRRLHDLVYGPSVRAVDDPRPATVPDGQRGAGDFDETTLPPDVCTLIDAAATIRELTDQLAKVHAALDMLDLVTESGFNPLGAYGQCVGDIRKAVGR